MPRSTAQTPQTVKLKPADPFDLIRWLARSQSDPRKAMAELVQNSIDAGARRVAIERRRHRGGPALLIRDDGEGILPAVDREEALRTIATNIGHSRKRGLSPRERHEQVVTGKYGIGLLGFWSIGHRMEIRSRVAGSPVSVLRLVEDHERAEIARVPVTIGAADTFTEIAVTELHESAARSLGGKRLSDYLAAELRGPILATGVEISVHDFLARGTAQKLFAVLPRRFAGERLALPPELPVADLPAARIELYLVRGGEGPVAIQVSCAGSLVADDIGDLAALGLDQPPWVGRSLGGIIDFPGFNVPPSTRRGVIPDGAAAAFVRAMEGLQPAVEAELGRFDHERREAAGRQVMQELKRAMRGLRDRLPQYELARVAGGGEDAAASAEAPGGPLEIGEAVEAGGETDASAGDAGDADDRDAEAAPEPLSLFPPGPLAAVRIAGAPLWLSLAPGGERRVTATAVDADGRRITDGVRFTWRIEGSEQLVVAGAGARPAVRAAPDARPGLTARLRVEAETAADDRRAEAEVEIRVEDAIPPADTTGFGIPEPELVDDPSGLWRSRFDGQRWQVNATHPDYVAARGDARGRFRYLLALLTKEIVQRTHGTLGTEPVLESFVEILAHAERNIRDA